MAQKLPLKTFLETFKFAPRPAVSLLIENNERYVLLTKRLKPPFANYWHLPGSFIVKNETIGECIRRIAKEELGIKVKHVKPKLSGVFENLDKDPRGHVIDIIYAIKLSRTIEPKPIGYTKEIKFFKKLPTNIGFNHHETLAKLGYK